jgi:hypothetical protein
MRLVDADALRISALDATKSSEFAFDHCFPYWQFSKCIKESPTIDPAKHGKWIFKGTSTDGKKVYECSVCHADIYATGNFCKECGAKIDGEV